MMREGRYPFVMPSDNSWITSKRAVGRAKAAAT